MEDKRNDKRAAAAATATTPENKNQAEYTTPEWYTQGMQLAEENIWRIVHELLERKIEILSVEVRPDYIRHTVERKIYFWHECAGAMARYAEERGSGRQKMSRTYGASQKYREWYWIIDDVRIYCLPTEEEWNRETL